MGIVLLETATERIYQFDQAIVTLGRWPDCDVVIDSRHVSRHHAELHRRGDTWALVSQSRFGTWVNGELIAAGQEQPLAEGDEILLVRRRTSPFKVQRIGVLPAQSETAQASLSEALPAATEPLVCLQCGALAAPDSLFCSNCGASLTEQPTAPAQDYTAAHTSRTISLPPPVGDSLAPVAAPSAEVSAPSDPSPPGWLNCSSCNALIPPNKYFCPQCSEPRAEEQRRPKRPIENMAATMYGLPETPAQSVVSFNAPPSVPSIQPVPPPAAPLAQPAHPIAAARPLEPPALRPESGEMMRPNFAQPPLPSSRPQLPVGPPPMPSKAAPSGVRVASKPARSGVRVASKTAPSGVSSLFNAVLAPFGWAAGALSGGWRKLRGRKETADVMPAPAPQIIDHTNTPAPSFSERSGPAHGDPVDCTVFAPPEVARGAALLVQVFAHLAEDTEVVKALAREFDRETTRRGRQSLAVAVERGARLDFQLVMPGLEVDYPGYSLVWQGRPNSVQFGVRVPRECELGDVLGTVTVSLAGIPIGHIKFKVTVGPRATVATPQLTGTSHAYRRAYLSYATEDWDEVNKRAQMLSALRIGFDDASLQLYAQPGETNFRRIDESDLFLLFWSAAARRSEVVGQELEYALQRKGYDDAAPPQILPVILEGPPAPPPPERLAHWNFDDYQPYFDSATAPTIVTEDLTQHWANPLGETVGNRYHIESRLGQGGFGEVYRARDRQLAGRPVVVKVLRTERLQNAWIVNKFRHEIEALARLNHPGIVGIFDTGRLPGGVPYLVMQYVEGESLRQALAGGGLHLAEIARLMPQITSALAEAHRQGILHRDLKPENIMLRRLGTGETQAVVIDFGLAKVRNAALAPDTDEGRIFGTYLYMSPEQLMGEELTAASDVYALGIVAYEMLTGARPFQPRSLAQLPEMQRSQMFTAPSAVRPEVPATTQEVLCRALAYEPARRYSSANEFGAALAQSLHGA